jgi:cytidylate kinase
MGNPKKITIAVDGYSSCGKSTIARALAAYLQYKYVDTGAMYRSVTLYALRNGLINGKELDVEGLVDVLDDIEIGFFFNEKSNSSEVYIMGDIVEQEIRQMDVNDWVSQVSAVAAVRRKMVKIQQELGKGKGIAMDGRDIGTTVFPDAELKLFMTADLEVRALRRQKELEMKKIPFEPEQVRQNLVQRDHDDMTRAESPLRKADDAIILDNTNLTQQEQLEFALERVRALIGELQLP